VRAIQELLEPIRDFVEAYVDDMAVYSDSWKQHLDHIDEYLSHIKRSGLTLNLNKCEFAKSEIKYVGHVIGSGKRLPDPEKVKAVMNWKVPETKKTGQACNGFILPLQGLYTFVLRGCQANHGPYTQTSTISSAVGQ
jgi:hypothetical protein